MTAESHTTTNHQIIRHWAETRGGRPATVRGTPSGDESAGILRIAFADGGSDEALKPIEWDDFFEKFDDQNLAFLYQDETKAGGTSRFFKFVSRSGATG
ncbi:MAG TPA: hypothetical protein VFL54_05860 [Gammaproteobacteria bacterium]|jgi:hypothetical protein|nr:hypothetical protein [Gammaproteobacteria bacterium]